MPTMTQLSLTNAPRRLLARTAQTLVRASATLAVTASLVGCAGSGSPPPATGTRPAPSVQTIWPERLHSLLPADVLLLGEQHDAPEHQRLQYDAVVWLATRNQLAAVVMEMADRGTSTEGLPRDANDAQAKAALRWQDSAWPWKAYGPVVMAAVGAGVPVLGGNLPRGRMRDAMAETAWDQHLPAPALERQYTALRDGHCGLLPESQIAPMARIQIARDASMARTVQDALRPGKTVVLVAGSGHVLRSVGVPTHWPENLVSKVALALSGQAFSAINSDADAVIETPAPPPKDHCNALRKQWGAGGARPG
jgi:uncharacterized iron-regulated protein